MTTQTKTWEAIEQLLRGARAYLGADSDNSQPPVGPLSGTLNEYEEFLGNNELELAWDALADVANRTTAPTDFWRKLAQAAALMELPENESLARKHISNSITSDQALAIAREEGEKTYRDLSAYRIMVSLETDGWHVDYELRKPLMAGGGPHYVIDAETGVIKVKRYE